MQAIEMKTRVPYSSELSSLRLRLQNIEERDNLLFERNLAFSAIIGLDRKIVNANKAFLANLGFLKSEIVGKPLINFIVGDQRSNFLTQIEKCFNGDAPSELEVGIYAKDGSVKTVIFSSTRLLFQQEADPHSILVSGVDISVRKKEEIKNGNYCRDLEQLAITDSLTGLYNHRYFMHALEHEVERFNRYDRLLCLLMFDVDDFKSYNDVYGHLEGDQLLIDISRSVKESLRSVDIFCRYAGDEFMVILPDTGILQVKVIAEKIKQALSKLRLKGTVTLSMGITAGWKDLNAHDFILKTDQALYQAKKEGKNGACCLA